MIEQTELVVTEWIYIPPVNLTDTGDKIISDISLEVMRKSAPTKKGLACRFSCKFLNGKDSILLYIAEDSYVIDPEDVISKEEILRMIGNSYNKFKQEFDNRKPGTVLQNKILAILEEKKINTDTIETMLNQ